MNLTANTKTSESTKPDLVLLHGWAVNSNIWNSILPELENSFSIHLIDLPGYGNDHTYSGDFSMESVVGHIMQRAPKKANWIAWSLGATIAMGAALKHADRFGRLQLISPTPKFMAGDNWSTGMATEPLNKLAERFRLSFPKGLKKFLLLQTAKPSSSTLSTSTELVRDLVASTLKLPVPSASTLEQSLKLLTETDLREQVHQTSVCTQIVCGTLDQIVDPEASRWVAETIPHAECKMLDSGHLPFIESKLEYLTATLNFFLEQDSDR